MWIIITWIVQIITRCNRRLLRHMGRWSRLVREVQPDIGSLFGTRARRLIPENNHGPTSKIHILKTWKQLCYCHKEDMIIITLTPQQHDSVRVSMNQRKRLPLSPPVNIAELKLQVW